jgi:hypothetical protein
VTPKAEAAAEASASGTKGSSTGEEPMAESQAAYLDAGSSSTRGTLSERLVAERPSTSPMVLALSREQSRPIGS